MHAARALRIAGILGFAALATALGPSPRARADSLLFTVTKTADTADGVCNADCSLREAITAANAASGFDFIQFAIPSEGGPVTIAPTTPLPVITSPVLIDGETQLGASCFGLNVTVELDGSALSAGADGLALGAGAAASVIRGLAIGNFPGDGIDSGAVSAGLNCDRIGTDASGTLVRPNGRGIRVTAATNEIGGTGANTANQISASLNEGIRITGTTGTLVRNNTIGVPLGGSVSLGNFGSGIFIDNASGSTIGGAGAGTVIHDNDAPGVLIFGASSIDNRITRNSFARNGGIGIDLLGIDFEDPNDLGDADTGPNHLQNSPAIQSASYDAGADTLAVAFRVESDPANAAYPLTVEFFEADVDGDEGETFLGSATFTATDWSAPTPLTVALMPAAAVALNDQIVATATDFAGNTSEFTEFATIVPEPGSTLTGAAAALAIAAASCRRARS